MFELFFGGQQQFFMAAPVATLVSKFHFHGSKEILCSNATMP
ncbi:MAG TPA: hypothetical protein PL045_04925 [Chitinophagaceae bacterium]|nr:hypothetical protein [Chitinophagaceae bacterium]